jgi:hypothetical protein
MDEAMFKGVERPFVHIFCIQSFGKRELDEFACDVLSRRMALRKHFLPSERLKMWLCDVDEAMFHGVKTAMQSHFLNSENQKKRLWWIRLSDVLSWWIAQRTHNLNVWKCDFVDIDDAMFRDVARPFERIFNILGIHKSDLDEVAEVMILIGEWP